MSVIPAITFGEYLFDHTDGQYGVIEVLLATGLANLFFSLFGGQWMVIVGVTAPVSVFSQEIIKITTRMNIPFLPFMFWVGIYAGIFIVLMSLFNGCHLLKYVTRYTCEIFALFTALIYAVTGIQQLNVFFSSSKYTLQQGLLCLLLGLGSFYASYEIAAAHRWLIGRKWIRNMISDYAIPFVIVIFSLFPLIPSFSSVSVPKISVPSSFTPTSNRSWFVNPLDPLLPTWAIAFAILPGLILAILFIFDHNVSSMLAQVGTFNLKKKPSYNYDFAIVGISLIFGSVLGLPFYNCLIPQSPLHVRSLADIKEKIHNGIKYDSVVSVVETRLANFIHSILVLVCCAVPAILVNVIGQIPVAILSGLFFYMAISSCFGNQMIARLGLIVADPLFYYTFLPGLKFAPETLTLKRVHLFTSSQVVLLVVLYVMTDSPAALAFPVLILLMIPLRFTVFPRIWTRKELQVLDGEEEMNELVSRGVDAQDIEFVSQIEI